MIATSGSGIAFLPVHLAAPDVLATHLAEVDDRALHEPLALERTSETHAAL